MSYKKSKLVICVIYCCFLVVKFVYLPKFSLDMSVNTHKISVYIDLVFCLVVLPLVLSIIPIEKMFASSTIFTVVLIIFLYGRSFVVAADKVSSFNRNAENIEI